MGVNLVTRLQNVTISDQEFGREEEDSRGEVHREKHSIGSENFREMLINIMILDRHERRGDQFSRSCVEELKETLNMLDLRDLPLTGGT